MFRVRTNNNVSARNAKIKKPDSSAPLIPAEWRRYPKTLVCTHAGAFRTRGHGKRPCQESMSLKYKAQQVYTGKCSLKWHYIGLSVFNTETPDNCKTMVPVNENKQQIDKTVKWAESIDFGTQVPEHLRTQKADNLMPYVANKSGMPCVSNDVSHWLPTSRNSDVSLKWYSMSGIGIEARVRVAIAILFGITIVTPR
ncbi:unnamed protein product [Phytophthora fragariaefolia]|uniref:Unnamed protein product n=1 Tax=Phytophthora fragariaefolia TaxID=1490495 RepID=A0A9W6X524_9STRA|nr:unnamed protein product [Phytophthora fragariaefolia]